MERNGNGYLTLQYRTVLYTVHHKVTVPRLVWLVAMESSGIISGFWAGWEQKQRYLNGHGDGRTSTEAGRKTVGPWAENKQKADNNLRGHLVPIAIPLLGQTGHMRGG